MVAYIAMAHINVGLVADGYAGEAVEGEQATALLQLCKNFLEQVEHGSRNSAKRRTWGTRTRRLLWIPPKSPS